MKPMLSRIGLALVAITVVPLFAGCRAYDVPEHKEIEPNETAFLIPLEGNTAAQQKMKSEAFLKSAQVAQKRVEIPHKWIQTGRWPWEGKYVPTVSVIKVDRKMVTREWTDTSDTGTSVKNQGISAETQQSISFMARMNCAASIDEADSALFLYRHPAKSLEETMDTQIRGMVESKFVEECAKYPLDKLLLNKEKIMNNVRKYVSTRMKDEGITLHFLGLKGEMSYINRNIQAAIDGRFIAEQKRMAAIAANSAKVAEAEATAKASRLMATTKGAAYYEHQERMARIQKWNGQNAPRVGYYVISPNATAAETQAAPQEQPQEEVQQEQPAEQPTEEQQQ